MKATRSPYWSQLDRDIRAASDSERARGALRFFKTGPGEYAEGDVFAGIPVPECRRLARRYAALEEAAVKKLLASEIHEKRLIALLILVERYRTGDERTRQRVYDYYLRNLDRVNNWDLVDLTADKIVGAYLEDRPRGALARLAASRRLWDRRVAVVATLHFIRRGDFKDIFALSDRLMDDPHDLMHKAVGWMLREAGKRSERALVEHLRTRHERMPRTMLRYAIERFPEARRRAYLLRRGAIRRKVA